MTENIGPGIIPGDRPFLVGAGDLSLQETGVRMFMRGVAIIALLALLAGCAAGPMVPGVGGVAQQNDEARQKMLIIRQALEQYKRDNGRYPTTGQGLTALLMPPPTNERALGYRAAGYLLNDRTLVDPWGWSFRYVCDDGFFYQLSSVGPDGQMETADDVSLR